MLNQRPQSASSVPNTPAVSHPQYQRVALPAPNQRPPPSFPIFSNAPPGYYPANLGAASSTQNQRSPSLRSPSVEPEVPNSGVSLPDHEDLDPGWGFLNKFWDANPTSAHTRAPATKNPRKRKATDNPDMAEPRARAARHKGQMNFASEREYRHATLSRYLGIHSDNYLSSTFSRRIRRSQPSRKLQQ